MSLAKSSVRQLIDHWKTLIQEFPRSDTGWRLLAIGEDRQIYQASFGKPNVEAVEACKQNGEKAALAVNQLSINHKKWTRDDFVFVSVQKKVMMAELVKRSPDMLAC